MKDKKITVDYAANNLHEFLRKFPWFQSVGVAGQSIYIYVTKRPKVGRERALLEALKTQGSNGFPVTVNVIGNVEPLTK